MMNTEQYISGFTKHLRVAEPKRSGILTEIKTHLAELETQVNPVNELGDPKGLARHHNKIHLGFFCSDLRLYIVPFLYASILLILNFMQWERNAHNSGNTVPLFDASFFMYLFSFFGPMVVALLMGLTLGKTHDAWHLLRNLGFLTIASLLAFDLLTMFIKPLTLDPLYRDSVGGISWWATTIINVVFTLVLMAISAFTIIAYQSPLVRTARRGRSFEMIINIFITVLTFIVSLGVSEFLAPYDTTPVEFRPPYPNPIRILNDFFETPLAALLVTGIVAFLLIRRYRRNNTEIFLRKTHE